MARFAIDVTACWRPQRVGMLTVAIELTKALVAARGEDQFTLLCSRERPPALAGLDCEAVLSPYRHEVALKTRWLPTIEAQLDCDAILYPYWPGPPRRRRDAPPAAVFVHDLAFKLRPAEVPWQQRLYMGAVLGRSLRNAAAVLVPSEATRRDLLACYPIAGLKSKVHVVPEGVSPQAPPSPLPPRLEPGFILAVGTVEPRKNYPRLLAAYRHLRRESVPLLLGDRPGVPELVIAGRPGWAYGDTLERIKAERGVRYLGHVDDATLSALYRSAAILAFPSLYEGFGLPLLEAMAQGLPAVVGNAGALPELADGAAILVDPEDVLSIAAGLERLLADTSLRDKLVAAGRQRAAEFTWERAASTTRDVLRRIALPGASVPAGRTIS
ncbi:MAG TPA: glycosyltransferase family 1 protein [Candidatus Dormibacteraeota bacterium]